MNETPHDSVIAQLPLSGFALKETVLEKHTPTGELAAVHNLAEITSLRVLEDRDKSIFVGASVCGVLAVAAKLWIPSVVWSWIAFVPLLLLALLLCFGGTATTKYLEITTRLGAIRYSLDDQQEDCDGFLLTLRKLMAQAKPR